MLIKKTCIGESSMHELKSASKIMFSYFDESESKLAIRISLGSKFQLKLAVLIFWTRFAQKGYFWSKTAKVNTIIELCILELEYILRITISVKNKFYPLIKLMTYPHFKTKSPKFHNVILF